MVIKLSGKKLLSINLITIPFYSKRRSRHSWHFIFLERPPDRWTDRLKGYLSISTHPCTVTVFVHNLVEQMIMLMYYICGKMSTLLNWFYKICLIYYTILILMYCVKFIVYYSIYQLCCIYCTILYCINCTYCIPYTVYRLKKILLHQFFSYGLWKFPKKIIFKEYC